MIKITLQRSGCAEESRTVAKPSEAPLALWSMVEHVGALYPGDVITVTDDEDPEDGR